MLWSYQNQLKTSENRVCCITQNKERDNRTSNKIDWNNFTHPIQDSYLIVFTMESLLAIELPNNELEEEREFMEEGNF